MTTSILVQHTDELNGYDLQVIRDFALEAPWEWRRALSAMADAYESFDELKEAKAALEQLLEENEGRATELKQLLVGLRETYDGGVISDADLTEFEADVRRIILELQPQEPSAASPRSPG